MDTEARKRGAGMVGGPIIAYSNYIEVMPSMPWLKKHKKTLQNLSIFFKINFYWSTVALQCWVSFECAAQ